MSKKILVTGAGGYVGNVLCRDLLMRGYKVRGVDNFHKGQCDSLIELAGSEYPGFEFTYGDVTNPNHVKKMVDGIDGIIHLAAIVGFPACQRCPTLAHAVNVLGTKNLIEVYDGRPFVFASTGSVYGKVEGLCTEDSPKNTNTEYGITKLNAENLVTNEKNTVAFRFATGFGVSPNMRVNLLVNDLVYQAVRNRSMCIFEADARRTFIHVRDMSKAFIFGLEHAGHLNYNVYNCGSSKLNHTKREIAEYVAQKTGAYVAYAEFGKDLDERDYEVDYSKLEKEGFKCRISLEEGIDELVNVVPLLQINHQYM